MPHSSNAAATPLLLLPSLARLLQPVASIFPARMPRSLTCCVHPPSSFHGDCGCHDAPRLLGGAAAALSRRRAAACSCTHPSSSALRCATAYSTRNEHDATCVSALCTTTLERPSLHKVERKPVRNTQPKPSTLLCSFERSSSPLVLKLTEHTVQ